jgi:hypothetical protein
LLLAVVAHRVALLNPAAVAVLVVISMKPVFSYLVVHTPLRLVLVVLVSLASVQLLINLVTTALSAHQGLQPVLLLAAVAVVHIHTLGRAITQVMVSTAVLVAVAQITHLVVQEAVVHLGRVMLVDQQAHLLLHTQVLVVVVVVRLAALRLVAFPEMVVLVLQIALLEHLLTTLAAAGAAHIQTRGMSLAQFQLEVAVMVRQVVHLVLGVVERQIQAAVAAALLLLVRAELVVLVLLLSEHLQHLPQPQGRRP